MADLYRPGSFYRTCDKSGFKIRAEDSRATWDGLFVDKRFWEPRHPQDFVRGRKDDPTVANPRPQPADVFLLNPNLLYAEDGSVLQDENGSALYVE